MMQQIAPVGLWDGVSAPDLMVLEQLDRDLFRNRLNHPNLNHSLFGGQVLAQALTAATATVGDAGAGPARFVHSLHGYFVRAGQVDRPVIYQVDRTRDGGRFSTRRVVALQDGEAILHMECGFHAPEDGFEHAASLPAGVPAPEDLRSLPELADDLSLPLPDWVRQDWRAPSPGVEFRPVDPAHFLRAEGPVPHRRLWLRLPSGAGADRAAQNALLCYLSDYTLAATAALPHIDAMPGPELFTVSLDHAIWFHRPVDVSQWLLFDCDSPSAHGGRGLGRGLIFAGDGTLVASVAQEGLMRPRRRQAAE